MSLAAERPRFVWTPALLMVLGLVWPASAALAGADDARAWVERMNQALATRNYDGVLVHQVGDHSSTLRLIHRIQDGHLVERAVSVDGSGRESIRADTELVGYFPSRRIVVVEKRARSLGFIGGLPGLEAPSLPLYDIGEVESGRAQGRSVRVVTVRPRDALRYGYRFWIDEKTAMPIQTQLFAADGSIIEQITFANLALPPRIADEQLKAEVDTEGYRWLRREQPQFKPGELVAWAAQSLPAGFRRLQRGDGKQPRKPSSHLMFTDGLASVSVFIESAVTPPAMSREGTPRKANGPAQLGAASAYTAHIDGYRVTAVGEVPPATVKAIAEALRPDPDGTARQ